MRCFAPIQQVSEHDTIQGVQLVVSGKGRERHIESEGRSKESRTQTHQEARPGHSF